MDPLAYLISPTNSLTVPNAEEFRAVKRQNFASFEAQFYLIFAIHVKKIAMILRIFSGKHVKSLEIGLETMI